MGLLVEEYPSLVEEIVEIYSDKPINFLTSGSGVKASWRCDKNHIFITSIRHRVYGVGCPYCSGNKILPGFNDLATTHPHLRSEWSSRNVLVMEEVSSGSSKKVWWVCENNHERLISINEYVRYSYQCKQCRPSVSSFFTEGLLKELHPESYIEVFKEGTGLTRNSKVKWVGECSHEWEATIKSRLAGRGCPYCAGKKVLPGFNDLATTHPQLMGSLVHSELISHGSSKKVGWVCDKGHEWRARVSDRAKEKPQGCPKCITSLGETEITAWLNGLGLNTEVRVRNVIPPKELDIYIPEKKLAVEFNGLYWHTEEQGKHQTYHHEKWLACKERGIQLIQVWEDDWNRNPDLIKRMLARKLGVTTEQKIYARKTSVEVLDKVKASVFLNMNHIQGFASGSYYLGLRDIENRLVAVLVLKKEPSTGGKTLNIIRYATSCNVVGGFTKLLSHAERTYVPDKFITFSDHCVSDGGLYENNGFTADKELPPDYMYVVKGERKHKFGYRLKKFRDDPALIWEEGLSERELAALNNLPRIWDAGKTRYVKMVT